MRNILIVLNTLAVALLGFFASATQAADDGLYRAFGQKAGIAALMDDFTARLKVDARIGRYFKETKATELAKQLTDQICVATGGPCNYEGETMQKSHSELEVDRASFNALVEVLQDAMDAKGIAFTTQNRLLALLAPMHRQIITR